MKYTRTHDRSDIAGPAITPQRPINPAPLTGTWVNFNKATGGVVRLVLTEKEGTFTVQAFGACEPSPCDWGDTRGEIFAAGIAHHEAVGFKAHYDFGFMETFLAAYLNKRLLVLDRYNVFKDGSGRSRYFLRDHLYQT
jgi:hypothetical protein